MFLATINKPQRLLHLSYIANVTVAELERGYKEVAVLLAEFPDGFRLLADFGRLESIDAAAWETIGKVMELMERHGLEMVVRMFPDPSKDIGFNILSVFHYRNPPRTVTCETMTEAARLLSL